MSNARKPKVLVTHPKLPSEALSILQEKWAFIVLSFQLNGIDLSFIQMWRDNM